MTVRFFPAVLLTALFCLSGCRDPEPAAPPHIHAFSADPNELSAGMSAKLRYEVEGASEVTLRDDTGASIAVEGDASSGEATVAPLATRFYLLQARNAGGESSAFVQVSVGEPLKELFLVAVPGKISAGDSAQLLWSAPGHKSARISSSAGENHVLTGDSGSIVVTPHQTTRFSLIADPGTGAPPLTAAVEVRVAPRIESFTLNPGAARAGETMTLSWTTVGGASLRITERSLGQVFDTADAVQVANASYDFVLPSSLPNGTPVQDGLPLEFVMQVTSAQDDQASAKLKAYVGAPPTVLNFTVPSNVTVGRPFTASWKTADAEKVEIFVNGLRVFASLPGSQAVDEGSAQLPGANATAAYELVATNGLGVATRRSSVVTASPLPQINSLTVPASLGADGSGSVSWTTQGATSVALRIHQGPNVYVTTDPAKAAAGSVTLAFGSPVRMTLEAINAAGDAATKTTAVISGGALQTSTSVASTTSDLPVTVSWNASAFAPSVLEGMPNPAPDVIPNSTGFLDLLQQPNAPQLSFNDISNAVTTVKPGRGFRFPFFGRTYEKFDVQIDGVVGLTPQRPSISHSGLPGSELGSALAPFWDELELGAAGKVHWYLEGTDFPRRLIIQWSNVSRSEYPGASQLTFQVQLYESGAFSFVYGTLSGTGADGTSATIGVQSFENAWDAEHQAGSPNAKVGTGTELSWFSSLQATGSLRASFANPTRMPVAGVVGSGRRLVGEAKVLSFTPGSVAVSEVMATPSGTLASGQWAELQNRSRTVINLEGLVLKASGSTTGFALPPVELQPDEVVVVGESLDPALNGGANVTYAWSDVPLSPSSDDVQLVVENGVVSSLSYTVPATADGGRSFYAPQSDAFEGTMSADGGVAVPLRCPGDETFGSSVTSHGSPGISNANCLPYRVERITADFEDLSQSRSLIFAPSRFTPTFSNQVVEFPLGAAGFKYFGKTYTTAWVSTNGFISFATALDQPLNRTVPSSIADAQGMIAPFWDDFDYFLNPATGVFAARSGDHWTIQWSGVAHASFTADRMNVEAKLFDDGTIEFHYGALTNSSSASTLAFGSSATAWCEMPGQPKALVISRNQPLLLPYTAYRFIPLP